MLPLSHHRSVVIHYSVRYEGILRRMLSCDQVSLGELIFRAKEQLGHRLANRLREFNRIRNAFAHDERVNTLRDVSAFVKLVNSIEHGLRQVEPSLVLERVDTTDMQQAIPRKEIVFVPHFKPPRLVSWGISAIAIACVAGIMFGGFTNTNTGTYKSGGIFGFGQDVHTEVRETPNVLFWLIVFAAATVAIRFAWAKLSVAIKRRKRSR